MIIRLFVQVAGWTGIVSVMLLLSAGTLRWPAAWVFLLTIAAHSLGSGLWLAKTAPALLAERLRSPLKHAQLKKDKIFVMVFWFMLLVWFIVMGLDERFRWSNALPVLQALGFVLIVLSRVMITWVMRTNSFASPIVKVQAERKHEVVSTGPYAFVRHPMYSGFAFYFVGTPLLLGSWWGFVMVPLLIALFAVRTLIEEGALHEGLPGYSDYAAHVRYRLVPGLW